MFSLGQLFLPHRWHEQMQADSHPIVKSLRSETLRRLGAGMKVLDTGSSCQPEQMQRGETQAVGAVLHKLDFCPGEGFDFTGGCFRAVICGRQLRHCALNASVGPAKKVCLERAHVLKPGGHLFLTHSLLSAGL